MNPRAIGCALATALAAGSCGPAGRGATWEQRAVTQGLDVTRVRSTLRAAANELRDALARDGDQGLLRLRLRPEEVHALFTEDGARRVALAATGFEPSPAERRWVMLASLLETPVVGFCARGVRMEEPGGEAGFAQRTMVVDRLLVVGREPDGLWGVWVEGLVRTPSGWRLLPSVPFERQVGTPRRDHADIALWDCDVGQRPDEIQ
jgi:hypothetical protein